MATPHIKAEKGDFGKTVLMPGDPLRAKWIAETYLKDFKQVNEVRGMLGFTGTYNGVKVSVMGSGMGIPTIGIYSHELFAELDVDNIIRIGSCGSYDKDLNIRDVFIATEAYSDSTYAEGIGIKIKDKKIAASDKLVKIATTQAEALGKDVHSGVIHSSDVFYSVYDYKHWAKLGLRAVEMEAFGLYCNAQKLKKNALTICTVSDSLVTWEKTTSEERQTTFKDMVEIALNVAVELEK